MGKQEVLLVIFATYDEHIPYVTFVHRNKNRTAHVLTGRFYLMLGHRGLTQVSQDSISNFIKRIPMKLVYRILKIFYIGFRFRNGLLNIKDRVLNL